MKCPVCKKLCQIPDNSIRNMENHHNSCVAVTDCCGQLVSCYPKFSFAVFPYTGNRTEDDWGREPTKPTNQTNQKEISMKYSKAELFDKVIVATICEGLADATVISGGIMKVIRYTAYCTAGIFPYGSKEPVSYDDIINTLSEHGVANYNGANSETKIDMYIGEG